LLGGFGLHAAELKHSLFGERVKAKGCRLRRPEVSMDVPKVAGYLCKAVTGHTSRSILELASARRIVLRGAFRELQGGHYFKNPPFRDRGRGLIFWELPFQN
jgi:hypothetical protein